MTNQPEWPTCEGFRDVQPTIRTKVYRAEVAGSIRVFNWEPPTSYWPKEQFAGTMSAGKNLWRRLGSDLPVLIPFNSNKQRRNCAHEDLCPRWRSETCPSDLCPGKAEDATSAPWRQRSAENAAEKRGHIKDTIRVTRVPQGAKTGHSCLLFTRSYEFRTHCHGRGRWTLGLAPDLPPIQWAHFCAHRTSEAVIIWGIRITKATKEECGKPNKR